VNERLSVEKLQDSKIYQKYCKNDVNKSSSFYSSKVTDLNGKSTFLQSPQKGY